MWALAGPPLTPPTSTPCARTMSPATWASVSLAQHLIWFFLETVDRDLQQKPVSDDYRNDVFYPSVDLRYFQASELEF